MLFCFFLLGGGACLALVSVVSLLFGQVSHVIFNEPSFVAELLTFRQDDQIVRWQDGHLIRCAEHYPQVLFRGILTIHSSYVSLYVLPARESRWLLAGGLAGSLFLCAGVVYDIGERNAGRDQ